MSNNNYVNVTVKNKFGEPVKINSLNLHTISVPTQNSWAFITAR